MTSPHICWVVTPRSRRCAHAPGRPCRYPSTGRCLRGRRLCMPSTVVQPSCTAVTDRTAMTDRTAVTRRTAAASVLLVVKGAAGNGARRGRARRTAAAVRWAGGQGGCWSDRTTRRTRRAHNVVGGARSSGLHDCHLGRPCRSRSLPSLRCCPRPCCPSSLPCCPNCRSHCPNRPSNCHRPANCRSHCPSRWPCRRRRGVGRGRGVQGRAACFAPGPEGGHRSKGKGALRAPRCLATTASRLKGHRHRSSSRHRRLRGFLRSSSSSSGCHRLRGPRRRSSSSSTRRRCF